MTTPSSTTSASLQQSTPTTTIVCTSHTSTTSASVQASSTLTNTNTTTVQQPILQPSASNSVQPPPSIRFQDPREEDPLIFELYLRKNVPRNVSICRGYCGKPIKPDKPLLIVKSFGATKWTDRKTGEEKTKNGPLYVHFKEKCLQAFDTSTFYGPGNRFDYSRISINQVNHSELTPDEKANLQELGVQVS